MHTVPSVWNGLPVSFHDWLSTSLCFRPVVHNPTHCSPHQGRCAGRNSCSSQRKQPHLLERARYTKIDTFVTSSQENKRTEGVPAEHNGSAPFSGATLVLNTPHCTTSDFKLSREAVGPEGTATFWGLTPLTWALINTHCYLGRQEALQQLRNTRAEGHRDPHINCLMRLVPTLSIALPLKNVASTWFFVCVFKNIPLR